MQSGTEGGGVEIEGVQWVDEATECCESAVVEAAAETATQTNRPFGQVRWGAMQQTYM